MPGDRLTQKQQRLLSELDELTERLVLDYRHLPARATDGDELTSKLEFAKRTLIIGEIVTSVAFFDEMLNFMISSYYFRDGTFPQLWKAKSFQRFNQFVLEKLTMPEKLALAQDIHTIPKAVVTFLSQLTELRNAVTHAFFPENLRGRPTDYRHVSIFEVEGFSKWEKDRDAVVEFFFAALFSDHT